MCEEIAKQKLGAEWGVGHSIRKICADADVPIRNPAFHPLFNQVCNEGVLLNKGTKKYKLDSATNSNRIWVYARAFSIAWGDNAQYWKWITVKESGETFEAAELNQVSWFDLRVKIDAAWLSSRKVYKVILWFKLIKAAYGWDEHDVTLELVRPNGCKIERKENLNSVKRGEWVQMQVGDLVVDNCSCEGGGKVEVAMYEHGPDWKSGLILKGVEFQPSA